MICVYKAHTLSEADIVAAVLQANGFRALVKDRHSIAMGTISPFNSDVRGGLFPVLVPTEEEAEAAREFLSQVKPDVANDAAADDSTDGDDESAGCEAVCGECGENLWYAVDDAGQIVPCPHCDTQVQLPPGRPDFDQPNAD